MTPPADPLTIMHDGAVDDAARDVARAAVPGTGADAISGAAANIGTGGGGPSMPRAQGTAPAGRAARQPRAGAGSVCVVPPEYDLPMRVGISSCLLGNMVRFDGGHKRDPWVVDVLGRFATYVPVCPEVECGMSIPREALRQVGDPEAPRLVTVQTGEDWTERMNQWATARVEALATEGLCGFIFKRASPSSGMERVKVYTGIGKQSAPPVLKGVGLFARIFMQRFPLLPVEEEGRLNDAMLRENFIERLFVMQRWQVLVAGWSMGGLVEFHTRHKLLVLAHSTEHYRRLGKLVAAGAGMDASALQQQYLALLMEGLRLRATTAKHGNVLQHVMGYFRRDLTSDEKQELLDVIASYRAELVPLIVPITLLNHYVRKYCQPYLAGQYYLAPHPAELKLRNHV